MFYPSLPWRVFRGGKVNFRKILLGIAKNPLIISSLLGLLALAFGLRFPEPVDKAISDLAGIATPFALFLLGGAMEFSRVGANLRCPCHRRCRKVAPCTADFHYRSGDLRLPWHRPGFHDRALYGAHGCLILYNGPTDGCGRGTRRSASRVYHRLFHPYYIFDYSNHEKPGLDIIFTL